MISKINAKFIPKIHCFTLASLLQKGSCSNLLNGTRLCISRMILYFLFLVGFTVIMIPIECDLAVAIGPDSTGQKNSFNFRAYYQVFTLPIHKPIYFISVLVSLNNSYIFLSYISHSVFLSIHPFFKIYRDTLLYPSEFTAEG